ncbi:hypothetical protein DPMN_104678 [Dreissena polymorpha]|nr:hypothetical protein DPMN_104678 [Dreissena polymorpha]
MSSCADVFIELLSTKNGAVGAVMCAGSLSLAAEVNSRVFWSSNNMLEVEPSSLVFGATQQALKVYLQLETKTIQEEDHRSESGWNIQRIRVTGLHMEEDFHVCYSTLQKQVDGQMASRTDVFLGAAKHWLWCTCSQRRRRFKKRNIAEKVNGTCKQDFTCRNGLIAVPTVNKDFICCEPTQQKIQVPGVDREMCLKKEFYYCDSTLQKQGLSRSDGKEDFKKESLLQLRPITR